MNSKNNITLNAEKIYCIDANKIASDLGLIKEGLPKHAFYTKKVKGALFNDDGTYAGPDVEDERSYCGTPIPKYTGAFSINLRFMKNFNLYVLSA